MSFNEEVKKELSSVNPLSKHCRRAEEAGIAFCAVKQGKHNGKNGVDKNHTAELQSLTDDPESFDALREMIKKTCCMRSFLRGAFISSGSINNPSGDYHFEITTPTEKKAEFLKDIMTSFGLNGKISERKNRPMVYLKDADEISDMLSVMEASVSMMNFENERILKSLRNDVNRKVNCEAANIRKTVAAAEKQLKDISLIEEKIGLLGLNDQLREVAELRMRYPEKSLSELGELMEPKLGRSGVNHRMEKIGAVADSLRNEAQ